MALSDDGMSSVEDVGFGEQIGDSFKSILAGIGMLPLSIFMIFKVETVLRQVKHSNMQFL